MNRIPVSQIDMPFSKAFLRIVMFHFPHGGRLWDPTWGTARAWADYLRLRDRPGLGTSQIPPLDIVHGDIKDGQDFREACYKNEFDGCFFDPPYIWSGKNSLDRRADDYGGYESPKEELQELVRKGFIVIHRALKPQGKLLFKYTDVFDLSRRKFNLGSEVWNIPPKGFQAIDHFIIRHRNLNPLAWAVKNRPCSVNNYSYLTILERKESP